MLPRILLFAFFAAQEKLHLLQPLLFASARSLASSFSICVAEGRDHVAPICPGM